MLINSKQFQNWIWHHNECVTVESLFAQVCVEQIKLSDGTQITHEYIEIIRREYKSRQLSLIASGFNSCNWYQARSFSSVQQEMLAENLTRYTRKI